MHTQGYPSVLVTTLIVALVAWRLYRRFRRLIARQRLSKWRPWVTVTVFPLFLIILGMSSWHHPSGLWALAVGVFTGVGLGILGLKLTKFETTPTGAYYTPSAHLGIALSALLVLRIGYRFILISQSGNVAAPTAPGYSSSPVTLLIVGAFALYYVTYAVGLILWSQRIAANAAVTQPAQAES